MTPNDEVPFHVERCRIRRLAAPELRKDPIVDRWVIISTDRLGRPQEVHASLPPARVDLCPFCAGHEAMTTGATIVWPGPEGWSIRVVPNMYPAVRPIPAPSAPTRGLLESRPGAGSHDVVIECSHHESALANLSDDHIANLLRVYRQRLLMARTEPDIIYPMIFKNSGADAGASLEHSHSQIVLLPCLPLNVHEELEAMAAYQAAHGRCRFCDWLEQERASGDRVIFETQRFVAISAYAARFPFETWLAPKAHAADFDACTDADLADLGASLRRLLRRLHRGLNDPPYNFVVHTAPLTHAAGAPYHWHFEILPRLTGIAGFEWGTGVAINPVPPEQAAAYLRGVAD